MHFVNNLPSIQVTSLLGPTILNDFSKSIHNQGNMPIMTTHFKCITKCSKVFTFAMALIFGTVMFIQLDLGIPLNVNFNMDKFGRIEIVRECNDTVFPLQLNAEQNWGQVDRNKTVYVISAYFVSERGRVFIIGTKPFYEVTVICQLWYKDSSRRHVWQTPANVVAPIGATGYNFTSTIFECVLERTDMPEYVALVMSSCDNPLNVLKIREASKPKKYKRRFTVCLSPVFDYDNAFQLVEWIELNKILGADKFIFYNYSTGVNVKKVIEYYMSAGQMEIIQWKIPFSPKNNIETYAQKAVINDCIFRNKNVSEFIVNIDKDEYIIPNSYGVISWSHLLNKFDKNYAGYVVRQAFFRLDWTMKNLNFSEKRIAEEFHLVTLTHFEREKKIWPPNHRSKYFARTVAVEFGNVHEIPRGRILNVPPEVALIHHYRTIGNARQKGKITDFSILVKYGDILTTNVKTAWKKLSVI